MGRVSPVVFYKFQRYPTYRILFISETITEFIGYTPEEHYSDNHLGDKIIHPEDIEKISLFYEYPDQTRIVLNLRFYHRNGSLIWTEHHLNFDGDIVYGTILNITERKLSEIRLKESEDRLIIALQTTGIAIWEWDVDTSVVSWKNSVEDVLGVDAQLINESIDSYFSVIHPEDKSVFLNTIAHALQNSDYYSAEHRVIDKTGQIRYIEAYAQIFRDNTGRSTRWLGTLRNITDRRKRELEKQELYERASLQSKSIVELALDESFTNSDLEMSLKILLKVGAEVLSADRTSLWIFKEDYSALECIYMYSRVEDRFIPNNYRLISSYVPNYFQSILKLRVFVANDTSTDEVAKEFKSIYSDQVGLGALMDASIRVRGRIVGVYSIENMSEPRNWKSDEIMYAGLLADQAAIATINSERRKSEEQVKILNKNLERIVEERTLQLRETNKDLSQTLDNLSKTQNQLIMAEKMASLGQLIAGIAHEINNPIGAIKASLELIRSQKKALFYESHKPRLDEVLDSEIKSLAEDFFLYALQLRDIPTGIKRRNIKSALVSELEKYTLGNKSYLAEKCIDVGILTFPSKYKDLLNHSMAEEMLEYLLNKIFQEKNYESIEFSVTRVASLVRSLRNFTHIDNSSQKVLFSVEESLETVVMLFYSKLKKGIEVLRDYQKVPMILCYPDDLMQLWTNLIQNALQAMDYRGVLQLKIYKTLDKPEVNVEVIDSGKGIQDDIKEKIFEPFFTTKVLGEGSGLGLDICRKIVQSHNGKIFCDSKPGWTRFHIVLPIS